MRLSFLPSLNTQESRTQIYHCTNEDHGHLAKQAVLLSGSEVHLNTADQVRRLRQEESRQIHICMPHRTVVVILMCKTQVLTNALLWDETASTCSTEEVCLDHPNNSLHSLTLLAGGKLLHFHSPHWTRSPRFSYWEWKRGPPSGNSQ